MAWHGVRCAIRGQGPGQQLVSEISRDDDREHPRLPPGQEVGRLPSVSRTGGELIIGTDRDIEMLFVVPVEIAERQAERPIGVLEPPLVGRRHALAHCVRPGRIDRRLRSEPALDAHNQRASESQADERARSRLDRQNGQRPSS